MIDPNLQMRFWRNFTDAMFHSTDAALAAAAEWQKDMLDAGKAQKAIPTKTQLPTPFWPMSFFDSPTSKRVASGSPMACFAPWAAVADGNAFSMMTQWANVYRDAMTAMGPNGPYAQIAKTFAPYFPWPAVTWAYMQTPLTAMLVSSGMPYAVAAPSAMASTCAMDAADAAREQMELVYASYRTDGGHAAAQLIMLPWTLAASFMTAARANAPSSTKIH